jgi:hypothetical protein
MKTQLIPLGVIAFLTILVAGLASTQAQTLAIQDLQITGATTMRMFDGTVGFQFKLYTDATLDSLGILDADPDVSNGTTEEAGLFDSTGTLLAEAAVPFGSSQAIDTFAYSTGFTPSNGFDGILTSGTVYEVGSLAGGTTSGGAPIVDDRSNTFTPGPHLTVISSVYNPSDSTTISAPLIPFLAGGAYLGPTFTYSVVPEPASYALVLAGLGALTGLLRRRNA